MSVEEKGSWLDRLDPKMLGIESKGDIISISIGDNASQVAAGKNITQSINHAVGEPEPGDEAAVSAALDSFKAEFAQIQSQLSDMQKYVGQDKIATIERQLTEQKDSPSGDLIREAGGWLLENVPDIGEVLLSLFMPAPVGRIVARTGEATVKWLKQLQMKVKGT